MFLFTSKKQTEIDKLVNENDDLKNQLHSVLLKHGGYEELENNLARAKKELADLHLKDEALNRNISQLDSSRGEKEKYLGDLNSKILELEEIKDNLHQTIQSYSAQVSILEERSKDLDEKLEHATEIDIKLAAILEKKGKLDTEIADKEQTFAYLSTIEREIQTELEKERTTLDAVKSQADSANNEILELSAQLDEKKLLLDSIRKDEEEISRRIGALNEDELRKTAAIKSLDEKISLNEEIKNNIETNLAELISRLNQSEKLYAEHSEKRESLSEEILKLQKERDDFDNKLNFAKEQLDIYNSETSRQSAILASLGEEIKRIENTRDALKEELDNLKQTEETSLAEIADKKKTIEDLEINKLGLEEITLRAEKNFNALVERYMLDFDDAKKINEELQKTIDEKTSEAASLDSSLTAVNTRLAEQEGLLRLAEKENDRLNRQIINSRNEKDSLIENISSLRENISTYNSQFTSLRYETESLQIKKSDLQRDLSFLLTQISREYNEAENRLKTLNDSISSGSTAYRELYDKISALKEELKTLRKEIEDKEIKEEEIREDKGFRAEEADQDESGNMDSEGFTSIPLPDDINDD